VEAVNEAPPPLMPRLATPELASVAEAEAVTGPDLFQPFEPFGDETVSVKDGATESTLMEHTLRRTDHQKMSLPSNQGSPLPPAGSSRCRKIHCREAHTNHCRNR